jgi:6-phosphogluconolactonase
MSAPLLVYVGTYTEPIRFGTGTVLQGKGKGIHLLSLDPESGALTLLGVAAVAANPSYLAFDTSQHFLYAVNELKTYQGQPTGTISAFAVDATTGSLTLLNQLPTHGIDPCHVTVDPQRRHAFVANFMSGSVCVLPIRDDGSLEAASDFIQHLGQGIDPQRQSGPHAHSVTLDPAGAVAFVPDLGLDKVLIYRFDAAGGMLEPNATPWLKQRPGSGPRHLVLHPNGRFAYLVNELNATVAALLYDPATGALQHMQTVPTLPGDFAGTNICADIQVHPSGRFVYASNRGHDSVAAFAIDPATGHLTPSSHTPSGGRTPRNFCLDPAGRLLLAANQDSDRIVVFRVDAQTGALQPTGYAASVPTPVCVKIRAVTSDGGTTWRP